MKTANYYIITEVYAILLINANWWVRDTLSEITQRDAGDNAYHQILSLVI